MKNLMNRIAVMAASAVVLGTMAYGQEPLTATVPFDFRTAHKKMPAGDYRIYPQDKATGGRLLRLVHVAEKDTVMTIGLPFDTFHKGSPAVLFRCAGDRCALEGVRTTEGSVTYPGAAKLIDNPETAVVTVPLRAVNGD